MNVALIGDVHASLPALEAVLADVRARELKRIWNVGDSVGYGAFPDECVRLLRDVGAESILGNYDRKVLQFPRKRRKWRESKAPEKFLAFRWAYENLSNEGREWLRSLPDEIRLEAEGFRILITHGSPDSEDEHLLPATTEQRLAELADVADADVVICGHSHEPFHRTARGVHFINTGSVGRPEGGDPRTGYATLTLSRGKLTVTHHRLGYDVDRAVEALRAADLPEAFGQMLRQGCNLDDVLAGAENCDEADILAAVEALAERCDFERGHTEQVTKLSLRLFDELADLHGLGSRERFWLHCGAMLHDIGYTQGRQGHHKTALRTILDDRSIPFDERQRRIVASIARYHRKALPSESHAHFAALDNTDRRTVEMLSGILRIADGLDRTHCDRVADVRCDIAGKTVRVRCSLTGPAGAEFGAAAKKSDLFEQLFAKSVEFEVAPETGREDS